MTIKPDSIKFSNRKTLCISINQKGELIVKAPYRMSMDEVFSYINSKQNWIKSRQEKIRYSLEKNAELIGYQKMLFLGKEYAVCQASGNIEKPYLVDKIIIVKKTTNIKNIMSQLKDFYIENCDNILLSRVVKLASKLGIGFNEIKIISSKAKWGMCDNNKILYFNFKLLMLTPDLIDYVIIHELCHIKQMNHSKKFWSLVGKILPNYKQLQKQMKDVSFLIKLY